MAEISKRFVLNEEDVVTLDIMKSYLTTGITFLKASGLRSANIEIELMRHIKKELNKEL